MTWWGIGGIAVGGFLAGLWIGRRTERDLIAYFIRVALAALADGDTANARYVLRQAIGEGS